MCGPNGGGDGGAAQAREDERIREQQIAEDKAKINALFGITDFDYGSTPTGLIDWQGEMTPADELISRYTPIYEDLTARTAAGETMRKGSGRGNKIVDPYYTEGRSGRNHTRYTYTADDLEALLNEWNSVQGEVSNLAGTAEENLATRNATLDQVYNDIMNDYMYELDKQHERKGSDVKAMIAGRGLSRSTVGQSALDMLGEVYDTQETSLEESADLAREAVRAADEDTRTNLLAQLETDGDYANARATAQKALEGNITEATKIATSQDLTNLFKAMDELYGQKQYVESYNQGQAAAYKPNITTPGSSSSGTGTVLRY